ncbi:MAG: family 20 glycosylhydrolase [Lentisphaeria bacterium]
MGTAQKILIALFFIFYFSPNIYSIEREGIDKPFRGFMIDAPRGIETMDYYFRLIDFLHEEEFNSIIFRLTDDSGSAYLFTSHPELNMCKGAFSANELKTLIEYAQNRDIELIPEIESFGHSKYITQTKKYKFLNDGPAGAAFSALCPVNDSTLALMKDIYAEVASIFPSRYFHIGCDEVNWGASEMSKYALKSKSRHQIWAEYLNKLNGYLKGIGKQAIIWGDVPLYHEKEVLDLLNRDIVIMDWNYWDSDTVKIEGIASMVLDKGFKLIVCPSVNWCAWGSRVGKWQFKNINAYAEVSGKLNNTNNLGIFLSNWVPTRYLQNSQWDTYTIAAEIVKNNGNYNYMDAIPAYVKDHFGTKFNANWEMIYKTIYEETPEWNCGEHDSLKFFPWSSEKDIKDILLKNKQIHNCFSEILNLMANCRKDVKKNKADFEALFLTVEFMDYNYKRQNGLVAFVNSKKSVLQSVDKYLKKTASKDQKMLSKINAAWKMGRRGNPSPTDKNYMLSFYQSSEYSKYLRENPIEFIKIIQKTNKNLQNN